MGLINEINNVNRTLQDNQQKELTKAEKNEIQHIRKHKLLILLKKNINELFEDAENKKDVDEITIEILKHKKDNIKILMDLYFEKYEIKLNCYELDYLDEIYNKTVYKMQKEYTIIFKEEERKQKELEKLRNFEIEEEQKRNKQKEIEKQAIFNAIITILKYIIVLLATPFILIMAFIWGICKGIK